MFTYCWLITLVINCKVTIKANYQDASTLRCDIVRYLLLSGSIFLFSKIYKLMYIIHTTIIKDNFM